MTKGPKLVKTDWQKDKIYLIQFPRTACIPSPSPYSLKLETWLRMADIDYENVSNEFKHFSKRGQQPFIELNGEQISDTSIIINFLSKEVKESHLNDLSPENAAKAHAFYTLIEHHLTWIGFYSRSQNFKWIASEKGYGKVFHGVKLFFMKNLVAPRFESKLKAKCNGQWIGTLSPTERTSEVTKDLLALSDFLGDKPFFFGSEPKTIDATLFGHLAQLLYTEQYNKDVKSVVDEKAPNLRRYCERMIAEFWPDWQVIGDTLKMDTDWKSYT